MTAVGLAFLAGLVGPLGRALEAGAVPERHGGTTYVVRPGDTLWGISERLMPGVDPRIGVGRISEANGVAAGDLVPGQALIVPSA
jgi:Tfp pilus assembly protein FimV